MRFELTPTSARDMQKMYEVQFNYAVFENSTTSL